MKIVAAGTNPIQVQPAFNIYMRAFCASCAQPSTLTCLLPVLAEKGPAPTPSRWPCPCCVTSVLIAGPQMASVCHGSYLRADIPSPLDPWDR
jgi:hypothetical protein